MPVIPAVAPNASPPAVLVLVPELRWADAPAVLGGWAKANLSLRSARARAGPADGYLTAGKGSRSGAPDAGLGPVVATPDGGLRLADWARIRSHDAGLHHTGELGGLGQRLEDSGRRWSLVASDPAAAAAAADRLGMVPRASTGGPAVVGPMVGLALASGDQALVVQTSRAELPAVVQAAVTESAAPACVLVASVSSPGDDRHLGVVAASPTCGLGRDGLASPSTHQPHLATLVDVAPTFLARLGVAAPADAEGAVLRASSPVRVTTLLQLDERAVVSDRLRTPLVWLFVAISAAGAAVAVRRPARRPSVAYALMAVPPSSFLIMAAPWWRWGAAGALLAGCAVAGALALSAAVAGRADAARGVWWLGAVTAVVVGVDAAFGGPLEIDAPFGSSAIGGGRFYGVGNIGSGFLVAGLLVASGLALWRLGRRAWPSAAGAMVGGVLVGSAPWFGADVGGVLASVPAYGTLVLAWRNGRPPWRLMVRLAVLTVAVLGAFLAVDLARPLADQTHLGRLVSGGDLAGEIVRKGGQALGSVTNPMSIVVVVAVVALLASRLRLAGRPALKATAWAAGVAGTVGSAVNDSGLLVAAAVAAVAWPALVAVGTPPPAPEHETERAAANPTEVSTEAAS